MLECDLPSRGSRKACGLDESEPHHLHCGGAGDSHEGRDGGQRDSHHRSPRGATESSGKKNSQQEGWETVEDIGSTSDQGRAPATVHAGDHTSRDANQARPSHRHKPHQEHQLRACHQPAHDVEASTIGTQPVSS